MMKLVRATYREIRLYAPDRTPCAIDLSDNTNLFGMPPAARKVLHEVASATVTRYPPLYAHELKAALARYAQVTEEQITTGCGSDDVLDSAIRAFGEPGDKLAFPEPTFGMMPLFARMNALIPVPVPLTATWDIDADGLLATGAQIIYICSPNNPTGTPASRTALERVISHAPGVVLLDEAYAEYAGSDGLLKVAPEHPRLLVIRTLSKAFGLAGLRVGYTTGTASLVHEVEKSRGPYKVNGLAERAALAVLEHDRAWVRTGIDTVVENRTRFREELSSLGLNALPSSANFVLVPVDDAARMTRQLRELGVAVRPFIGVYGVGDALRISIGPWEMMEAALKAMREILG